MSLIAGNEAFLALCIKYAKEKITVDFEALAKEIKMSKGGAANKFRGIMKQLEEEGAAWTNKDDKAEPNATPTAGVKRKAGGKKAAPNKNMARISVKAGDESDSDEIDDAPPKKMARGKATKTKAAKLAEVAENDKDLDAAKPVGKKSKGKGAKKVEPATSDDGSLGDDEATPGNEAAQKFVKKDVDTARMVKSAAAISKSDAVSSQDEK